MKAKSLISVAIALALSGVSLSASAATIAGTSCSKVGITKTVSNVKYFCVKSGQKLLWNKGTVIKVSPTPTPSKTIVPTPVPTSSNSQTPKPQTSVTASAGTVTLTIEEVAKHNSADNCWSIVYGNVYDLTKWIPKHPGGPAVIRALCGKDGSTAFEGQHANQGKPARELAAYFKGKLGDNIKL